MTIELRIGDVFDRLAEIPDGSIDLVVTSPPFLALRSYLPADHPDKHLEIGSEATPADFLDTLLALTAEWGRVLAPRGSICVELGDTYAGSGGAGGDYAPGGLRDDQARFDGSASKAYGTGARPRPARKRTRNPERPGRKSRESQTGGHHIGGSGWPLAKSMCVIPHLYAASLAYGMNVLTGSPSPAGLWRIRNVICWARPNPPVGALGDKFRPATSYITVACRDTHRYFDLDAVRGPGSPNTHARLAKGTEPHPTTGKKADHPDNNFGSMLEVETTGAPPLDWHADAHPEDGDWLWKLPTRPYKGSHYAVFPEALPRRLIEAMCPQKVCTVCGQPSERITEALTGGTLVDHAADTTNGRNQRNPRPESERIAAVSTLGWTDCGHDNYRTGVVLDPFAGSGTTLAVALGVGRHAIGIDLDARNVDLARDRVGMFLDVDHGAEAGAA